MLTEQQQADVVRQMYFDIFNWRKGKKTNDLDVWRVSQKAIEEEKCDDLEVVQV